MRRRFCSVFLLLLPGTLALGAGRVSAQAINVRGVVVEGTYEAWVGGARVQLSNLPPYFTDLDGRFEFRGVQPGRHTLTVTALGYRIRSMEVELRADTVVIVELDPDPILLDSLLVRAGRITIRGEIRDAVTRQRVLHAQVTVLPDRNTTGAVSGRFRARGVPVGQAVTVLVESVGYLPARFALITEADTTLNIELAHDSVAIRMVAHQVEKLEVRSRGVSYTRRVTGTDELSRRAGWTVYDLVTQQLASYGRRGRMPQGGMNSCLFIDDTQIWFPEVLHGLMVGEVERIEIYDRGGMIRVYTRQHLVGMLGREPPAILYMKIGLGGRAVCR